MNLTNIKKSFTDLTTWTRQGFADLEENIKDMAEDKLSMMTGRFVANQTELDLTKNSPPNQGEVFNSWHRFSHMPSTEDQPAIPGELDAWTYDAPTDTIRNTTNSASYIGVVSKSKYDQYLLNVFIDSTDEDDDSICLILAWYVDPLTKREHTLSVVRSPGGNGINALYSIIYNWQRSDSKVILNGNTLVKWGNNQPGSMSAAEAGYNPNVWNWPKMQANYGASGNRLRVVRNGDIFSITTAQWGSPNMLGGDTLLTLNLNSDPLLAKFKGERSYGFSSQSQAYSSWRVDSFTNPKDRIYNLKDNEVWEYANEMWSLVPGASIEDLGNRVMLYNPITKKMFYMHDAGSIVRIDTSDI